MHRVKDSSGSILNLEKILLCIKKIVLEKIEENNDSFYIQFQIERRQGIVKERALAIDTLNNYS